jgi:F0F1-type ATP synthase delta subunit
MKHSVRTYAKAFSEVAAGKLDRASEDKIVKNFLALVQKNGDSSHWNAILKESAKMLREKEGKRGVVIETARPLNGALRKRLEDILQEGDVIEEKIDATLVAGVRVTVNEESQFDASLSRKLQKLFA